MSLVVRSLVIALCALVLTAIVPGFPAGGPVSAAQARATISGSVVDAALVPLPGVVVSLESADRVVAKTTSDTKGLFRLTGIATGEYKVRAVLAGFPVLLRDVRVAAGVTSVTLPLVLARPQDALDQAKRQADPAVKVGGAAPVIGTAPPPASGVLAGAGRGGAAGGTAVQRVTAMPVLEERIYSENWRRSPEPGETYDAFTPNRFHTTRDRPLSTFGADVDTASYSNVRRFLSSGQLPPREAVRVEEFINYFQFGYTAPRDGRPIALTTEIGDCPWAPSHKLVLIGARASSSAAQEIAGRNLVLLIDVSGSMAPVERLPMIKTALGLFVDTLRPDDTLSIVTYAGSSGVALHPTPARRRDVIQRAIAQLNASGSTNGAQGLLTAYRIAREAFIPGGVNRVILATDGDFNVGITSQDDLLGLIERQRESGVFLSVFGVGSGNLKDATMEMLADRGNGHYAYLDSLQEARRVLIRESSSTLETVAKDVKFQVEFNPAVVAAWKLIGYENRALAARDFNNDRKDAGEMGAGDTVTVLYEVIPVGADMGDELDPIRPDVDPLKYQGERAIIHPVARPAATNVSGEWLTVKARFKLPEGDRSDLITQAIRAGGRVQHLPLAAAVAEFGLLLRDQPRNDARWEGLVRRLDRIAVPASQRQDVDGLRELVATGAGLARLR